MSRAGSRDPHEKTGSRSADRTAGQRRESYSPVDGLRLPRGEQREPVQGQDRTYSLRGSESRVLATVGAFRVVPAEDLTDAARGRDVWHGDIERLAKQGLVEHTRITINKRPTTVLSLTREGKALLEAHRENRGDRAPQRYHAGFVKPRELGHDAQAYRLFRAEAARIEQDGGRVRRVVLDYELKHDYQTFLHQRDRRDDAAGAEAFGAEQRLPVTNGHIELPDLRIEYETEDGRVEQRDVELVTEHYSRGQLAAKGRSGFSLYRSGGGLRGENSRHGGSPIDPHNLEWLK